VISIDPNSLCGTGAVTIQAAPSVLPHRESETSSVIQFALLYLRSAAPSNLSIFPMRFHNIPPSPLALTRASDSDFSMTLGALKLYACIYVTSEAFRFHELQAIKSSNIQKRNLIHEI
jgi:hypothetical protein